MLPKITIVSASVGAGHDGAARELARRLAGRGFDVAVLDFLDLLPGRLGPMVRHAYATELAVAPSSWGWLLRGLGHQRAAKTVAALAVWAAGRATLAALGTNPAVVVSTYPLASQVLGRLRREGSLTAPVVTFLTDLSVHPLWVADGVDLHLAIHEVAARQAAGHGARVRVAGPAVAPAFHPDLVFADGSSNHSGVMVERRRTRFHYGVPADRPAALVVAGSWGIGEIEHTMRDIAASGLAVPVALCGNNEPLRHRLVRAGHGPALGWVDDPAPLIRACDVVVQNAGGLTSLEALACDRPVISYRCLAGHGTTNAAALHEAGLAVWASDRSEPRSRPRRRDPGPILDDAPQWSGYGRAGPPVRRGRRPGPAHRRVGRGTAGRAPYCGVRGPGGGVADCPATLGRSGGFVPLGPPGPPGRRRLVSPRPRAATAVGVAALAAVGAHALPALASLPALRRRWAPDLAGIGRADHVALTFDDGPDPRSTPSFLSFLEGRGVRATFFLLGRMAIQAPGLAREMAAAGHEIGLHGYDHRCLLLRGPRSTYDDLARGRDAVEAATGTSLRWFRPPYGVLTTATLVAARRLGLTPVLWTAWGRDWSAAATPASVVRTVRSALRGGGTILLHDSDSTSAPGSWRATLAALPDLLDECDSRGWTVGPLGEHGFATVDRR